MCLPLSYNFIRNEVVVFGSPCWTRTNDLRINRARMFKVYCNTSFCSMRFLYISFMYSQHFVLVHVGMFYRLCSKIVPKFAFIARPFKIVLHVAATGRHVCLVSSRTTT